ncbi:hypothetical protein OG320_11335 [Microbispora sp. NBC_01189]|uniref:alpha/beta fold hydrolase n=1 Tax=Microbispora sp. NBC_01189 TaxID=2903583 RepID=UPI002E120B42|nr:hypothetical protein OG320_11335 [Microbispora sp. NBC_01189]
MFQTYSAHDGTTLAYRVSGAGDPVICLPGGPMQSADYLGELGGLPAHRRLLNLNTPPGVVAEFAALFPHAEFAVQPGAGHFPWLDDARRFVTTTAEFLTRP